MPNLDFSLILTRVLTAGIPLLMGIILHELAHAWVAKRCGDPTAENMGRITLNPLPHIDPTGLLVFVLTAITSPFVFGWAKPVSINPNNFRNITRDTMLVSAAGPLANFILAFIFTLALAGFAMTLSASTPISTMSQHIVNVLYAGIRINFLLAWFNLLPLPPLDGSKILWGLLPPSIGTQYMKLERFGFPILILLLFSGIFEYFLWPLVNTSTRFAIGLLLP